MAIIINFQEYVKAKSRKEEHKEIMGSSSEFGKIIYFTKEAIEQWDITTFSMLNHAQKTAQKWGKRGKKWREKEGHGWM